MKKIFTFTILLFWGICETAFAQLPDNRFYGTQISARHLVANNIISLDPLSSIERFNYNFRTTGHIDSAVVGVVFHLLLLPEDVTPLSLTDVQAQVARLNTNFLAPSHPYLSADYQHPGLVVDEVGEVVGTEADLKTFRSETDKIEHFAERAGNPLIEFCLVTQDDKGNPSNGLVQVGGEKAIKWSLNADIMNPNAGGSAPWDPTQFLNIWVARLDSTAGAGWAQMPGGPGASDGIVIDDRFFKRATASNNGWANNEGVTLSHLVGNYLGLYDLWNELEPCGDDYVDDTPIHNAPNLGLPEYNYRHVSTCDGNPVEMFSNLMDNAPDSLQYIFTWGQCLRMQATLAYARAGLRAGGLANTACGKKEELLEGDERSRNLPVSTLSWSAQAVPNPSAGLFAVNIRNSGFESCNIQVLVLNTLGEAIWQGQVAVPGEGLANLPIAAQHWPKGLYTIQLLSGKEQQTVRVVLE